MRVPPRGSLQPSGKELSEVAGIIRRNVGMSNHCLFFQLCWLLASETARAGMRDFHISIPSPREARVKWALLARRCQCG